MASPSSKPRKRRPRQPRARTSFTLPAHDQRPRYEVLIDLLRQQITQGHLKPGDPVPSVRQFISDLGVSHTTVTRALRTLVEQGVLETKVGSGTRVAIRRPRKAIGILGLAKYGEMVKSAFMMRTLHLLQQRIIETGRTLLYRHINPDTPLADEFDHLSLVDGLVLVGHLPMEDSTHPAATLPADVPIVGMSCLDIGRFPVFKSDDAHDSARLIHYLASLGHRHIATLYMDLISYTRASLSRVRSVREALDELGMSLPDAYFINGTLEEQVDRLLQLRPRPTVIFMASGIHRFPGIFAALKDTPLDMRTQTLVAAYDEDLWMQIAPTGIEHIRLDQPLIDMINLSFESLETMIEQGVTPIPSRTLPSRIVHVNTNGDARPVNI